MFERHGEQSVVIKAIIPRSLKLRFKLRCVQKDLKMSTVLECLIQQWVRSETVNVELINHFLDEGAEEVKGYIPKSLKRQFKVMCTEKQVGMGFVLHFLIQEWVQAVD